MGNSSAAKFKRPRPFSDQLHFFPQVYAGATEDGRYLAVVETGGIVFHADGVLLFIELDLADAIDFPGVIESPHLTLTGRRTIFEDHIQKGHLTFLRMIESQDTLI